MWKVTIIESERGWGQRVDDVLYFKTHEEAKAYQMSFNAKNDKDYVPDWYVVAHNPVFVSSVIEKALTNK